jgi:hypothetical protein
MNGAWGLGCERLILLSDHASLLLLSGIRLLSLVSIQACVVEEGQGQLEQAGLANEGELLDATMRIVQTLTQPLLSMHSWYNSIRQEVTERRGGGSLPTADGSGGQAGILSLPAPTRDYAITTHFSLNLYCTYQSDGRAGVGGRVARLAG